MAIKLRTEQGHAIRRAKTFPGNSVYHDAAVAHALMQAISTFPGVTEREPNADKWIFQRAAQILRDQFGIEDSQP